MQIHNVTQGSAEWLELRARHFTASEAPAMLGLSKYKTRDALLREKATGITEEIDADKQSLFDRGHEAEAAARPLAEAMIHEELFPATGTETIDGLPLLASFDGITMMEDVCWENKLWNKDFATHVRNTGDAPDTHWPQLEQQLLVSGAKEALFTVSDGTPEHTVSLWYASRPERRAQLIAGWKQFAADVANYQHVESAPAAVAAPITDLPALAVEITGRVVASNLVQWKGIVVSRIEAINTDLQTDQDFADAEATVKFLDEGEKKIDLVKAQAQANAADIDTLFRAMDEIRETMRSKRLALDKLVKARKESIKVEIVQVGQKALAEHVAALNKRLATAQLPIITADFGAAIKGKRSLDSMRSAVSDLVAAKKIEASAIADKIAENIIILATYSDHAFLFNDRASLLLKDADDLQAVIANRIAAHKAQEEARLAVERERIRAEEEARARRALEEKAAAEARQAREAEAAKPAPAIAEVVAAVAQAPISALFDSDTGETIKLGEIGQRLGFAITADFLASLGFSPVRKEKAACLYSAASWPAICRALINHIATAATTDYRKAA